MFLVNLIKRLINAKLKKSYFIDFQTQLRHKISQKSILVS